MAGNGSQQRKPGVRTAVEDVKALATVLAMEAESILGRRTARVLGALALFAAVSSILVWYIAPSGAAEKQALVVTLAQILGGTALLSGLYFTWRTLQVNREGQITERFTRSIDQLGKTDERGNELFEIRLGGIYALERIARESDADYWPIMEILTAYVRQHAPLRPEREDEEGEPNEVLSRRPDIHAITTVLRRRTGFLGSGEPEVLDLSETNLSDADFSDANLFGAKLSGADLSNAFLEGANLSYASLFEASLFGASLFAADLSGADLSGATGLTQTELNKTVGDEYTDLPSPLKPPANWGVKTDEQIE